jgi:hypothetical protein
MAAAFLKVSSELAVNNFWTICGPSAGFSRFIWFICGALKKETTAEKYRYDQSLCPTP